MPQNTVITTDVQVRARMRRLLAPSFNQASLCPQAPALDPYTTKFLAHVNELYDRQRKFASTKPIMLDFLDWSNFYTMDIISDPALGESFHCLDDYSYHSLVKNLFKFFKGMVIASAAQFFPITKHLLQYMVPKDILEKQRQHTDITNTKILQRLERKPDRPDLIMPFPRDMQKSPDKMSLEEIQSTFAVILVAGCETTTATLVGVLYKLATHPRVQERPWELLRKMFENGYTECKRYDWARTNKDGAEHVLPSALCVDHSFSSSDNKHRAHYWTSLRG